MKKVFEKEYHGFEDLYDAFRDFDECFDPRFNEQMKDIPGEFTGTIKVTVTYEEKEQ